MEPIVEAITNPEGQSFYAAKFDVNRPCNNGYWHIHPEYELVYVKNGSGPIHVGSHFSSYKDGMLLLLGPNIPHTPFANFEFADNIEIVVQFRENLLLENIRRFPEFKQIMEVCQLAHSGLIFSQDVQQKLSHKIAELVDLPKPLQLCRLLEILLELAYTREWQSMKVIGMKPGINTNDYNRVNRVYDYVAANYKQTIRISDAAEQVGLTTNSFCRFFKKVNRKSFIRFVNEFRINKAVELMNFKDIPVAEAMYASGYNDPSFFSRQFKRLKGMSPSEYRRKIWKEAG